VTTTSSGTRVAGRPWLRRRRVRIALAGVALLSVALAANYWFLFRDTSEPVSVADALDRFQASSGQAGGTVNGVPAPAEGVYAYSTTGGETFDLGFVDTEHVYPATTVMTVTREGCGLRMVWEPLAERSSSWETCPASGGWTVAGFEEQHEFFGQRSERAYRCEGRPVAWSRAAPRRSLASTCASPQTTSTARGRSLGLETLQVDGRPVETVHVRLRIEVSGESDGAGTSDTWYAVENGLVVRRRVTNDNETDTSAGSARYGEAYEVRLESLEPRGGQ
jgi:hypothetical protein